MKFWKFSILPKMSYVGVRCTCGKVLADKQIPFENLLQQGVSPKDAMDQLKLSRYCCRTRMMAPGQLPLASTLTTTLGSLPQNPITPRIYTSTARVDTQKSGYKLLRHFRGRKNQNAHAGIIPKMWNGSQWLYILGRDTKTGKLTEFGGTVEDSDVDIVAGAFREFNEESLGVFGDWMTKLQNGDLDSIIVVNNILRRREWLTIILPVTDVGNFQQEFEHRRSQETDEHRLEMSQLVAVTKEQLLSDPEVSEDLRAHLNSTE